jgi:signal transduction histidine kinase
MSRSSSRSANQRRGAAAAVAGGVIASALWLAGALEPVDRAAGDLAMRMIGRGVTTAPVAVVEIDDASIAGVGPLPWPRSSIAAIVTASRDAGAAAVIVDLLLTDPGPEEGDRDLATAIGAGPAIVAAAIAPDGGWVLPHARFGGAARAAHVHVEVAADGVARTIVATKQAAGLSLPAISLAAARVLRPDLEIRPGLPLRPDFRPDPSRIVRVPAAGLLGGPGPAGSLAGRLVFVGVTATGAGDRLVVPTDPGPAPSPGVLVHASATASILRGGLVRPAGLGWVLGGSLLAALAIQLARERAGALRPLALVGVLAAVGASSFAMMAAGRLLLPVAPLALAPVIAVVLREAAESRAARRESGILLESLLGHLRAEPPGRPPTSAVGSLEALRELQAAVLREDGARRALLDGMADGVVLWDRRREVLIVNPAARRLWGGEPAVGDLEAAAADRSAGARRAGSDLEVSTVDLEDGGLAILRDVTAERELERRRRDMQRLVSHELKTPLASIAGLGETMERYELARDEQRRVATLIRSESTRLGEMVTTFLDLERLGSGGWEPPETPVDLAALVAERLEVLDQTARSRGQRIARRLGASPPVRVSPILLARVVDNLVGNALAYSPDGTEVVVEVAMADGDSVLTVADHGPGIPADAIPHLFERFYRVPGTARPGSGLGLAVAHEVVTWHGGCITVDSTVGRGTIFTVRLPGEG